jgi:hypothetical protein
MAARAYESCPYERRDEFVTKFEPLSAVSYNARMKIHLSALFVFLMFVLPAHAWHTNTHFQMTRDAMAFMPSDLKQILTSNKKFVEEGIKDPDLVIRDWQNHYFIPSDPPQGGGLDRIEKIIKIVNTKLQGSNQVDAGKQLCYLAHYIGDLWSPENAVNKKGTNEDVDFVNNERLDIVFEGYSAPISNYHDYLMERSKWRWKIENSRDGSRILYNEAVNDIARIWLSVWQQAGHPVDPVPVRFVEHKPGTLNVNYARLLAEEMNTWGAAKGEEESVDQYAAHYKEMDRLRANVVPTTDEEMAKHEIQNQQQWLNQLTPTAPFEMLETSLKTVGDQSYLVARFKNKIQQNIPSVAFMYPGVKGPAALITNVGPGEVIKVEATLPPNAQREKIQMVYSSLDQGQ